MTRFILAVVAVMALSELAPARSQLGYSGGYSYSYRGGFGFALGGPRIRAHGFAGGFSGGFGPRVVLSPAGFGFVPVAPFGAFGPVGFAPIGVFRFGNPFWGGWGPGLGYGLGYGYGPPVVAVPVPVVVGGIGPDLNEDGTAGNVPPRNGAAPLPQWVRPGDFVVISPRKEATIPGVARVAPAPRPARPAIAFDPFKPAAGVKGEAPEADPKKEAERLVKLAQVSFAAGDYGRAAEHFERAIAADPTDAAPYFWLAQAKFASGQYAEAVARIRAGLVREPKWPATAFDPAALYGDRPERFVVHLLALKKAQTDNPNEATLEFLLGYELWFGGEKAEADKLFRAAEKRLAGPGPIALFK